MIVVVFFALAVRLFFLARDVDLAQRAFNVQPTRRYQQLLAIVRAHPVPIAPRQTGQHKIFIDIYGISESELRYPPTVDGLSLRTVVLGDVGRLFEGELSIYTMEIIGYANQNLIPRTLQLAGRAVELTQLAPDWLTNLDRVDTSRWVTGKPEADHPLRLESLRFFVVTPRTLAGVEPAKWIWFEPSPLFAVYRFDAGALHAATVIWKADDLENKYPAIHLHSDHRAETVPLNPKDLMTPGAD